MPGTEDTGVAFRIIEEIFEQEEFEMMTKQAELKKQAYASTLKSRALSVLIYLIDRSNKELTCFPAIPTMAEQLHISVSTVKRALHELLDAGYIKKDARFREKNKGQTSNLYTLVLFEEQPIPEVSHEVDCDNHAGVEPSGEISQERKDKAEREVCQVKHISFDTLKRWEVEIPEAQKEIIQPLVEDAVQIEEYQEIQQDTGFINPYAHDQALKYLFLRWIDSIFILTEQDKKELLKKKFSDIVMKIGWYLWTGEGFSLMPL